MKKKISILLVSLIGFFLLSFDNSNAQEISTGEGIALAGVVLGVYNAIDENCDDKRKEGTLQTRCKDGDCVTVSCISFRKACDNADGC
ncbi:hypothetical protein ACPUEN_16345 [Algoriphagus yeomjeoni]|uniref:hypothetical protein n=1 Tax=Algoriphagus yeomjeoni TaxID=291403 RepID=UPI003CE560DF